MALSKSKQKIYGLLKDKMDDMIGAEIDTIMSSAAELEELTDKFGALFEQMNQALSANEVAVDEISESMVIQAEYVREIKEKIDIITVCGSNIFEINSGLSENVKKMNQCNTDAEEVVASLVKISDDSEAALEDVRQQTNLTNQSVQEIRTATEIIAGIASQTNMLALNASIEAARAGEHGKGFAVVAEEIRKLADQSNGSADQIKTIVNELVENADVSVSITEKVMDAFDKQKEKIAETDEIFKTLNGEVLTVSDSIAAIGAQMQIIETNQTMVEENIVKLNDLAEKNVANADDSKEAVGQLQEATGEFTTNTETLIKVSDDLANEVQDFKQGIDDTIQDFLNK